MTTTAISTLLSLAGIWIVAFWFYRAYRVDVFRQEVFSLRDEFFDFALEGGIAFGHPAYQRLRNICNGYIRFGHRVNLSSVLLFYWDLGHDEREWIERHSGEAWSNALDGLDSTTRERVKRFRDRLSVIVTKQFVFGSPLLVATIIPVAAFAIVLLFQIELGKRMFSPWVQNLDDAASALGQAA